MNNTTSSIPGVIISTDDEPVPGDYALLCSWFNVVRAMRSVANTGSHAVVKVIVVVDELGRPLHNTHPEVKRLEPKSNGAALDALLDALAD